MIQFAIVGTGRISDWVLRGALQDSRFKAVAVCSRTEENAAAFVAKHPEAFDSDALIFTDIDSLAECGRVDAVYIGTPNSTHCDYALRCLSRGKAVLCEKPMGCNAEEVERMIQASVENRAALMEAMISTLNPNFRKAAALVKEIGRVRYFNATFCQYSSKYDALQNSVVASSFNPLLGGGALADIGIYTTYPLISLFGEPMSVKASRIIYPTQFGYTDIQGSALLTYPGMTATLSYSKVSDSHLSTEICGEKGNIILDAVHICRKVQFSPHAAPTSGRGPLSGHQVISQGLDKDEYFYEFEEFINTVEGGSIESSINSHEVSLANRRLMDKIAAC